MKQAICEEIARFVSTDKGNQLHGGGRYFDDPLVGFAAADDPIFTDYKSLIGEFHLTPGDLAANNGNSWLPRTVVCWVLPISEPIRRSNRSQMLYPSRLWAETRNNGEAFNASLRRHLLDFLLTAGFNALAPQLHSAWKEYSDTPIGRASSWSERHAAYAAGLGTFSLNDALITPRGIAHRCGSVITDLAVDPSPRNFSNHLSNCLFHRDGTCGACIHRCPVGALSKNGHDKEICCAYVYQTIPKEKSRLYNVTHTGCGLCQTNVPCESRIPFGKQ